MGLTTLEGWEAAADLLYSLPDFGDTEGVTYANLDATFGLDAEKKAALVKKFHDRGQKCGTYGGPFLYHRLFSNRQVPGSDIPLSDLILKDARGNQSKAARVLGTTKRIIQYKVEKYGIDVKRFKSKKS